MVEYGLILGVIAVAAIGVLLLLGPRIKNIFQSADDDIQKVPGADRPEN
jgi:Flp pilus assembly pilin Flp